MPRYSETMLKERNRWRAFQRKRPSQIIQPCPGQESVWDYPRPPAFELRSSFLRIIFADALIAESQKAVRMTETSCPPVYYLPPEDVRMEYLEKTGRGTLCEWKGLAQYWSVQVGKITAESAAWSYPDPEPAYCMIRDYLAFYPSKMDVCMVDGQIAVAQTSDYYGGWITSNIVGPFKGGPGSEAW